MTTTLTTLLTLAALAAAPEVKLRPLDGASVNGTLTKLSSANVKLETKDGEKSLPVAAIMWVEFAAALSNEQPTAWIELLDGSRIVATAYTAAGGRAQIVLASGQTVELPTRSIHTVRFRAQTPELAGQWREITAQNASADMVVIRKTSMRMVEQGANEPVQVTEQSLDQLEGTLHNVTAASVQFEYDGDKIDIPRQKLEGLIYYQAAKREFSSPLARLIDAGGSSWALRDLKLDGQMLAVSTVPPPDPGIEMASAFMESLLSTRSTSPSAMWPFWRTSKRTQASAKRPSACSPPTWRTSSAVCFRSEPGPP